MKYMDILNNDINNLSEDEKKFAIAHQEIVNAGCYLANGFIQLANSLKKMKDNKYYISAGFEDFKSYVENAIGIKERQAYNYISVVENLDSEFLHLNAKIGITKLLELSKIEKQNVDIISNNINLEDTTVKDLKLEIEKLKSSNLDLVNKYDFLKDKTKSEKAKLQKENSKLEKELEKIKNAPKEVEIKIDESKEKELSDLKTKLQIKNSEFETLKKNNEELASKLKIQSSPELIQFKIQFDELQHLIHNLNYLIVKLPIDKQEGCKNALKKVVETLC